MSTKLIAVIYKLQKSALVFITVLTVLVGLLTPQQVRADDPPAICITTTCHATFDVEALRENYFNDWRIEADAVDVNILEAQPNIKPAHDFDLEAQSNIKPPYNFDVKRLGQRYFDDWQIEADVIDASIF